MVQPQSNTSCIWIKKTRGTKSVVIKVRRVLNSSTGPSLSTRGTSFGFLHLISHQIHRAALIIPSVDSSWLDISHICVERLGYHWFRSWLGTEKGAKPLIEAILTQIYVAIWRHSLCHNELNGLNVKMYTEASITRNGLCVQSDWIDINITGFWGYRIEIDWCKRDVTSFVASAVESRLYTDQSSYVPG